MRRVRLAPEPRDAPERRDAPPPRGLPLGPTPGLVLALTVSVVLGVTTAVDQHHELAVERAVREARLEARLAELRDELAAVPRPSELPSAVASMRDRLVRATGAASGASGP